MNEFDQFIKHTLKEKYYIRYTDDFVIVHHDQNHLAALKQRIEKFLDQELGLSLHPDKVSIRKYAQGVDFLGYIALPHAILLRTKTKRRVQRKLRERTTQFKRGFESESRLAQTFASYMGVLKHADTNKLKQKIQHDIWALLKYPDMT